MRTLNIDVLVAVLLLALCGVFFNASYDIRDLGYETMGAEVWPRIILVGLFVMSCVYLVGALRGDQAPTNESQADVDGSDQSGANATSWAARMVDKHLNAFWCFLLFFLFLITLDYLGMLIGGVLFVFLTLTALGGGGWRAHLRHAVIAVVTIGGMWAIFTFGLRVILPEGELLRIW